MSLEQMALEPIKDPMDYPVHASLQARILERVAFPSSRAFFQRSDQTRSPSMQVDS